MSACPSLPIATAVARAGRVLDDPERVPIELLTVLGEVADPRRGRGVRHRFAAILAIGIAALLGGARTYVAPLCDRIDLTDALITADALHTQRAHAEYLHARGAHYVLIVKGNHPGLHHQLAALPWTQIPPVDNTRGKGHGRIESRTLKLAAVTAGIGFPHACLAIQLTRRRRSTTSSDAHTEIIYAVTDLTWDQIRADQLAEAIRRHWHIENRLHWIRDVVFAEDHSQIRTGTGPAVLATLRNLAISLHRLAGATNIAAACRHVSRHPNRALALLT